MKGAEKPKINAFSISEIIKAKQKEFKSNQNSLKETNSALTKTKDYSKEDNILQNTFSGKLNNSKRTRDENNKTNSNSKHTQFLFKTSNKSFLSNNHYNNNSKYNSNNNMNKSIHSKNLNLELKKIENILKYKEDANFNDSKYCDSRLDKISNDKTNVYANHCGSSNFNYFNNLNHNANYNDNHCNYNKDNFFLNSNNFNSNLFSDVHREKSRNTFSRIQHKLKRSSMSSKFLNLYLGEIKNMSKDDLTTDYNMLTQINLNVNSLLFRDKQNEFNSNHNRNNISDTNKNKEKEFENITMLNISDSYLVDDDLDESSRIKINRNKYNNNPIEGKLNNNDLNEKENSMSILDIARNVPSVSINNLTSKFNYCRSSNLLKFNSNENKLQSNPNVNSDYFNNQNDSVPNKIKKNRKNFLKKNVLNNINNSFEGDEYISCLTDENQINPGKREDNTVVNLFNYLNFSDAEINYKNSNNMNFNFSNLECSDNALINSNNFNNNFNNWCGEGNEFKNGCSFGHSKNLIKISSKSFKGSLSGISKITTNNHRNKHFYPEENNVNNKEFESTNKIKDINKIESPGRIQSVSPNNTKLNVKKNAYCNNENKLSNISILSIKSDYSESGRCSVMRYNTDDDSKTIIINKINKMKPVNLHLNNSEGNMSYYASDVDEFENTEQVNKQNVYNLEVKDQLIERLNTEESANIDKLTRNKYAKNFSDCKKQNTKKNFLMNFLETERFECNNKKNAFLDNLNKNSSVKNILSLKKLNFFDDQFQFKKQANNKKSSIQILPIRENLMNPNNNNNNIKGINKYLFFDVNDYNRKKLFYRNVSKKLKAVRLSSNPSYSELGQDVTFESDKIHKIQSFK